MIDERNTPKWGKISLQEPLLKEIDRLIKKRKNNGMQKYATRAAFIRAAVHRLLEAEKLEAQVIV